MKYINDILLPFDFTAESLGHLVQAIELTESMKAKIHFCHVLEPIPDTPLHPKEMVLGNTDTLYHYQIKNDLEEVSRKMKYFMKALVPKQNQGSIYTTSDSLHHAVETIQEKLDIDLVVMGKGDEDKLINLIRKSKLEKVLDKVDAPVLSLNEDSSVKFETILIPTDISNETPKKALNLASYFSQNGSKIHFINIITTESIKIDKAKEKIIALAAQYHIIPAGIHITYGDDEVDFILNSINKIEPDLVLMKTYDKSSLWSLISSSVAQEVVTSTSTPTLVEQV